MTAPHEVSPHPPSETPRPPQPTASFAPGPGFVVALVVIVLIVVLALAAAVSSALGVMGVSRLLGGAALVLVGAGLVVALRVPARSVMMLATAPPSTTTAWTRSHGRICWRSRPIPLRARVAASRALRPMKGWEAACAGTPVNTARMRRTPSQTWSATSRA